MKIDFIFDCMVSIFDFWVHRVRVNLIWLSVGFIGWMPRCACPECDLVLSALFLVRHIPNSCILANQVKHGPSTQGSPMSNSPAQRGLLKR